jgi:hypothetical protein
VGIALSFAAVLWPVAALVAWVLALRDRAAARTHDAYQSEARRTRVAQDVEAELRAQLAAADARLQRLESRLAVGVR